MENTVYSNAVDQKWQQKWAQTALYRFDEGKMANKFYLLEMFSYPSGKNLHVGHWWNYSLSDSYGRMKRMQGYEVFHPPGFDAFGLPAENYAIKTGVHPGDSTRDNIAAMERQFRAMGAAYDWDHEIVTCGPDYYKWTQWLFLRLYERGLAYRKEAPVNWCPSCMTVLANEQVIGGRCERCGAEVVRRDMTQWFFKITDYSQALLDGLKDLDWPEKTKRIQENWIGKSTGCEIDFPVGDGRIRVFTTRADTLMGVTYLVLAPEHPLADRLTEQKRRAELTAYRESAAKLTDIERQSAAKAKTGVFTGAFAVHPVSGKPVPVWVSDYVLASYGTGAVMAVPAHDERDRAFAGTYGLPIVPVVADPQAPDGPLPYCGDGILAGSGSYDGLRSEAAREKITADLERRGLGRAAVKYRLRDWLVSRQRYWGAPIPIVYCDACGTVPVPEGDLPVTLPYEVAFLPNGRSPLADCAEFVNTPCPACGRPATRETDTLDTFVCSSWYYLRFLDSKNEKAPFDPVHIGNLLPVDKYVGGIEHAAMHLLYARFITKALRDMGCLSFDEPFLSLVHQGVILDADGKKMSKRSGAVSPDSLVARYGADVFRLYLGFGFSYLDGGPWNDEGIKAADRFVKRVCRAVDGYLASAASARSPAYEEDGGLEYLRHLTIREVTADMEGFRFNTAIARLMEFVGALVKYQAGDNRSAPYERTLVRDLVLLLAPLAPHLAEELWARLGGGYSVHNQAWPKWEEARLRRDTLSIAVQVNGSLRSVIEVSASAADGELKAAAMADYRVAAAIGGREVKKTVIVKGRLINLVC